MKHCFALVLALCAISTTTLAMAESRTHVRVLANGSVYVDQNKVSVTQLERTLACIKQEQGVILLTEDDPGGPCTPQIAKVYNLLDASKVEIRQAP